MQKLFGVGLDLLKLYPRIFVLIGLAAAAAVSVGGTTVAVIAVWAFSRDPNIERSKALAMVSVAYSLDGKTVPRSTDLDLCRELRASSDPMVRDVAEFSEDLVAAAKQEAVLKEMFAKSAQKFVGVDAQAKPTVEGLANLINPDAVNKNFHAGLQAQNQSYKAQWEMEQKLDHLWDRAEDVARSFGGKSAFHDHELGIAAESKNGRGVILIIMNQGTKELRYMTVASAVKKKKVPQDGPMAHLLLGAFFSGMAGENDIGKNMKTGAQFANSVDTYSKSMQRPYRTFTHLSTLPAGSKWEIELIPPLVDIAHMDGATISVWGDGRTMNNMPLPKFDEMVAERRQMLEEELRQKKSKQGPKGRPNKKA